MAEECKDPTRHFPKVLLTGLVITGTIYVLVSISAITLVSPEQLGEGETPLLQVVQAGAPNFPVEIFGFITMFAVANSALINMLMASRLVYGMSREHVLPAVLGKVHPSRRTPYIAIGFTTLLAFGLITFVGEVPALGGTTALLLLVRLHRRQHRRAGAAPRSRRPPAFPHADDPADTGRAVLRVSRRPMDWPRSRPVQDRRNSDRHRRRAVGGDRAGQSRHRTQACGAYHGRHRRKRAAELEYRIDLEYCHRRVRAGRTKQQREDDMQTKLKLFAFATAAMVPLILTGDLQAQQQPPQPPQFPNMTFFITSTGGPQRRQLRRPRGRRQALPGARRQGRRRRQDLARLSQRPGRWAAPRRSTPSDRIGNGPWVNAAGVQIAVERRRPAFRQQQDQPRNHPRRERPADPEPALHRQPARHPDRHAGGRHRAARRTRT